MRVVCIPTNKPIMRIDALDYVYAHKGPKLAALIKEVKERHEKRPTNSCWYRFS